MINLPSLFNLLFLDKFEKKNDFSLHNFAQLFATPIIAKLKINIYPNHINS